jgi:hypothetical protein
MIHNQWIGIEHHDSQPLGSAYHIMIDNHFAQHNTSRFKTTGLSVAHHDSQPLAQNNTPWLATTGSVYHTTIHNHWLSITRGCASWCVMLSQGLWIIVSYDEPVVMNHGVLCWASGCESWCVILKQWLWIMVCYSEPVVVNHGQPLAQHS